MLVTLNHLNFGHPDSLNFGMPKTGHSDPEFNRKMLASLNHLNFGHPGSNFNPGIY